MPFTNRDQYAPSKTSSVMQILKPIRAHLQTTWSHPGTQSIAVMGLGNPMFGEATSAISNFYAMATMQCPPGILKEYQQITQCNEKLIIAQLPLATPKHLVPQSQKSTPYTATEDPFQIVNRWAQRRNWTITDDNRISVSRAVRTAEYAVVQSTNMHTHTNRSYRAGKFTYRSESGGIVRYGQVVCLEMGFKIVPINERQVEMRNVLYSISVIDSTIANVRLTRLHYVVHTPLTYT